MFGRLQRNRKARSDQAPARSAEAEAAAELRRAAEAMGGATVPPGVPAPYAEPVANDPAPPARSQAGDPGQDHDPAPPARSQAGDPGQDRAPSARPPARPAPRAAKAAGRGAAAGTRRSAGAASGGKRVRKTPPAPAAGARDGSGRTSARRAGG